jgi:hypothetical protein
MRRLPPSTALCSILSISHVKTTAYHPQSNGLVERFHRRLKEALQARAAGPDWLSHLPWVLLGIRSAVPLEGGLLPVLVPVPVPVPFRSRFCANKIRGYRGPQPRTAALPSIPWERGWVQQREQGFPVGILSSHRFLILLHPFPNRIRIRIRYPFPAARAASAVRRTSWASASTP